ncbi:LD-carboxypeptidase [Janibacter sp. HTCC2649]|uniref:S66 peptidase family protein n=1 Tax=Janibacter sp. HTCC2649 TaxID=313589 RepID=UPI0003070F5D|nr:LD-carboxypeptidase [Janibacter sp. HTCC2649]
MAFRAPRSLVAGDRVAVIAPSSSVAGEVNRPRVEAGIARLRGWGLEVVEGEHLWASAPASELAGGDVDRAADLARAWSDPSIAAIICARGGYGMQRLLPVLPPGTLSTGQGKWLVGFSDVTPLLHRIAGEAGLQSIHGPMVAGLSDGEEVGTESLRALLFGELTDAPLLTGLTAWRDGEASGSLIGGNVALLAASVGTGDLVATRGGIAFFEDVGQHGFVLDRSLTQLLRAGWFDGVVGVLIGDFTMDATPAEIELVLRDRLLPLGVPVWAGGTFGHAILNRALPHGADVALGGGELRLS